MTLLKVVVSPTRNSTDKVAPLEGDLESSVSLINNDSQTVEVRQALEDPHQARNTLDYTVKMC